MDEIKYKLTSSNTIIATEGVNLLMKSIIKLVSKNDISVVLDECFSLLQEKCTSEDPLISITACYGLLKLLEDGYMDPTSTTSLVTSMILSAKNVSAITPVMAGILKMGVLQDIKTSYECKWKITSPVHPFIILLSRHPNCINDVYNEMFSMCSKNSSIHDYSLELLKPVFIWILCHPKGNFSTSDHLNVVNILLSLEDVSEHSYFILKCLAWQQISKEKCMSTYEIYAVIIKWAISKNFNNLVLALLPVLANIAHELIINGYYPNSCLSLMENVIFYAENLILEGKLQQNEFQIVINCIICLLAETILVCSVARMSSLISMIKRLSEKTQCPVSISLLLAAFIQWEYNKNLLTSNFSNEMRSLIMYLQQKMANLDVTDEKMYSNELFHFFKSINRKIYVACELWHIYRKIIADKKAYGKFNENWNHLSNVDIKLEHVLFLQGLLVLNFNPAKKCYDMFDILQKIMDIINIKHELMLGQLPIILYCLKFTNNPQDTICFLKSVPELAALKENIPVIISILKSIDGSQTNGDKGTSKNVPLSFVIDLYLKLVDKQSRCYPFLETVLAKSLNSGCNIDKKWELLTAQAKAVKHICQTRGNTYGKELVPILSEILSQSVTDDTTTACCLSISAIEALWKAEVIDPISSWQVLAPKFNNEKREAVKISICQLLSVVPALYYNSPEFDDFMDVIINKLWKYTMNSHSDSTIIAAFNALSKFKIEFMTFTQIPDIYKEDVKIPSSAIKNTLDSTQKSENTLSYIPSNVWGNIFKHTKYSLLPGVQTLCFAMMEREVIGYRSGVYIINIIESETAKYLPLASVVRGLMEFVRKEIRDFSLESLNIIFACLTCLSMPLSKPLPPINWCFLSNIIHQESLPISQTNKLVLLQLLGKQAETSPSALKILTDYLESLMNNIIEVSDAAILSSILPYAARFMKPPSFLSVLEKWFQQSFSLIYTNKDAIQEPKTAEIFLSFLRSIGDILKNESIQNSTKILISNLLLTYWKCIEVEDMIWQEYAETCLNLPDDLLNKMLLPINEKSCYMRCKLSEDDNIENSLDWLNDIIDTGIELKSYQIFIFSCISRTLKSKTFNPATKTWFLQLMRKIQVELKKKSFNHSVDYLCNILIISVIVLSQHYLIDCNNEVTLLSRMDRLKMFPQAVTTFFQDPSREDLLDTGFHLLEWIYFIQDNISLQNDVHESFSSAIVANRQTSVFENTEVWSKYISTKTMLSIDYTL